MRKPRGKGEDVKFLGRDRGVAEKALVHAEEESGGGGGGGKGAVRKRRGKKRGEEVYEGRRA